MRALARLGFAVPRTRMTVPTSEPFHGWLRKPRRSGGGHDIGRWRRGIPLSRRHYLQQWIDGVPGSLVFVANGRDAMPLGLTRQLAGETALGARRFGYCGSILADPRTPLFDGEDRLRQIAAALAGAVTRAFGLVGLNGIDFIARDGVPYPTEVNPRYSASMELLERAYGVSLFELHLHGCLGRLPRQSPYGEPSAGTHGKAIVFARRDSVMDDTTPWLAEDRADIPHPGDRIGRGKPVCTVFARARDGLACREALLRQAAAVDDQLRRWRTEPSRAWSPA
jgi:predicted ATP-grasp superfamily ATP-dependent carboligase